MNEKKFTKLSNLVDDTFTVLSVGRFVWKQWDNEEKRMLISDSYQKGYRKIYTVTTDKGSLDLGSGQLGNLLEAVFQNGVADITNVTFAVKSNGKSGIDIRYFFNVAKPTAGYESFKAKKEEMNQAKLDVVDEDFNPNEEIDLSSIPF